MIQISAQRQKACGKDVHCTGTNDKTAGGGEGGAKEEIPLEAER